MIQGRLCCLKLNIRKSQYECHFVRTGQSLKVPSIHTRTQILQEGVGCTVSGRLIPRDRRNFREFWAKIRGIGEKANIREYSINLPNKARIFRFPNNSLAAILGMQEFCPLCEKKEIFTVYVPSTVKMEGKCKYIPKLPLFT